MYYCHGTRTACGVIVKKKLNEWFSPVVFITMTTNVRENAVVSKKYCPKCKLREITNV